MSEAVKVFKIQTGHGHDADYDTASGEYFSEETAWTPAEIAEVLALGVGESCYFPDPDGPDFAGITIERLS